MSAKIVVLYPHPQNEREFELDYVGRHLPLMRQLVGADVRLPTYKLRSSRERLAPFYRLAEIHYPSLDECLRFASSEAGQVGRESSHRVSSGGAPIAFVCEEQPEI